MPVCPGALEIYLVVNWFKLLQSKGDSASWEQKPVKSEFFCKKGDVTSD